MRHAMFHRLYRFLPVAGLLALLSPLAATASEGNASPISVTEGASRVVALSAGHYHTCGLRADGSAICWGTDASAQSTPTSPNGPYLSLSAGGAHTCGLRADGSAACWGSDTIGQSSPPGQNGPFLSLSLGNTHTCALRTDGSAACWGRNTDGQRTPPSPNGPFLLLSSGANHTCGVRADGAANCWGSNADGQLGAANLNVHQGSKSGPFLAVSGGGQHTCGLMVDAGIKCWGRNVEGQLDGVPSLSKNGNVKPGPFVGVSAGSMHTCGLKADGDVVCWGWNNTGQLDGIPDATNTVRNGQTMHGPFVAVAAGTYHTCAQKADGAVTCWGAGDPNDGDVDPHYGQSTVPGDLGQPALGQIAAGNAHACQVRRDGKLACWGWNDEGQTTAPAGNFTQVVAGDSHSCAIRANGQLACWGRNAQANVETVNSYGTIVWRQLAPGPDGAICGLLADDDMWWCIRDESETQGFGNGDRNITHDLDDDYGNPNACAVSLWNDSDGFCWVGFDADHGWGTFVGNFQRLESGLNHQCGLKLDGSIECWGDTAADQMTGMEVETGDVTRYTLEGPFRTFSAGWNHACGIRANGTLACWGSNQNGQATPPAGTYVQVAAGNTFTCAIRSNGTRVCWGSNNHGQAPQLALSPASIAGGQVNTAHLGATFALTEHDYLPESPAFAVTAGSLPDGLDLSTAGVLSGTPTAGGTFTFTVEGEDANGFAASREYTVTIIADTTPPVIDYTLTGGPLGSNDWYRGDVSLTWSVTDAESAITGKTGCVDSTLSVDTNATGVTYSCSATSTGGTTGPVIVTLKRDATAPTASIAASPGANAAGWHNTDVTILSNCSDATPGSGIASCPSVPNVTAEGTTTIPAQQVADNAGNTGGSNTLTIKLDKTAPTVSAAATTAPNGSNGWYVSNVTVAFSCNDALSGVVACPASQTLSAEGSAVASTAQTVNDIAGNASAQSNIVTVKIDKTAPTLDPTTPSPLLRGQSYSASANASDAISGIASSSCGALDTSSLGDKSTSCSATDKAGNMKIVTLNYTVTTTCGNDGYKGTQLTWCRNICEMGYTGATLDSWIHRWINKYRDLPYCQVGE